MLNRIARVLRCQMFIHAVSGKLSGFAGVAGAIAAKGLPVAPLLLLFLVPTAVLVHGDLADKVERIQLFKNLAIKGGLLLPADQDSRG